MTSGNTSTPAACCTISREPGTTRYRRSSVAVTALSSLAWVLKLLAAAAGGAVSVVVVQALRPRAPAARASAKPVGRDQDARVREVFMGGSL